MPQDSAKLSAINADIQIYWTISGMSLIRTTPSVKIGFIHITWHCQKNNHWYIIILHGFSHWRLSNQTIRFMAFHSLKETMSSNHITTSPLKTGPILVLPSLNSSNCRGSLSNGTLCYGMCHLEDAQCTISKTKSQLENIPQTPCVPPSWKQLGAPQ